MEKLKALPKSIFLKVFTKMTFVNNFTAMNYFPQQQAGQILNC